MSSSLLVVVAAGKCPHLQSRYFGAFPECTQWDPFIRSDCRGLCFTLHSTHKHSNKDISASSVSYTTHIFTCRAPRCEHNTFPCSFIRKTEWLRKAEGKASCEMCSSYNPINQMLTADQTDQKQAEKQTPAQGGNGSKCQSTLGAAPVSCSWTGLIVITLNGHFKQNWGETKPHIRAWCRQGWQVANSNVWASMALAALMESV